MKEKHTAHTGGTGAEAENEIRSLQKWSWLQYLIIPVCGVCGFAGAALFASQDAWGAAAAVAAVAMAAMAALLWTAHKRLTRLKSLVGASITLPILRELFDVEDYRPGDCISAETVRSAGLFDRWERMTGSDYFKGRYKGIGVEYSDVHLENEEIEKDDEGKKQKRYETVFKGQWLVCDFGKELAATVRLFERSCKVGVSRSYDASKSSIETENMEFNKKYRIESGDGHSVFYLLTPHFIERLMAADEKAGTNTFFCFQDGKVHIALYSGRNSFELGRAKAGDLEGVRRKFRGEARYIADFIDVLLENDTLYKEA